MAITPKILLMHISFLFMFRFSQYVHRCKALFKLNILYITRVLIGLTVWKILIIFICKWCKARICTCTIHFLKLKILHFIANNF